MKRAGKSGKTIGTVAGGSVILALLAVAFCIFLVQVLRGDVQEKSDRPQDYHQWALPEKYSRLLIFPQTIPTDGGAEDDGNVVYCYRYESGYTRPMCQIYLRCTMEEQTYWQEVQRLEALKYTDEAGQTQSIRYDETSFRCPAYVANAGYDFCYEYALVDEAARTITYVYAMNTIEQDIKFSKDDLPDYFMEDFTNVSVKGLDRFTMYERYQDG